MVNSGSSWRVVRWLATQMARFETAWLLPSQAQRSRARNEVFSLTSAVWCLTRASLPPHPTPLTTWVSVTFACLSHPLASPNGVISSPRLAAGNCPSLETQCAREGIRKRKEGMENHWGMIGGHKNLKGNKNRVPSEMPPTPPSLLPADPRPLWTWAGREEGGVYEVTAWWVLSKAPQVSSVGEKLTAQLRPGPSVKIYIVLELFPSRIASSWQERECLFTARVYWAPTLCQALFWVQRIQQWAEQNKIWVLFKACAAQGEETDHKQLGLLG